MAGITPGDLGMAVKRVKSRKAEILPATAEGENYPAFLFVVAAMPDIMGYDLLRARGVAYTAARNYHLQVRGYVERLHEVIP